jgi:large repetitive protein
VRRHAAVFLLAVVALLLTPGAAGLPNVPGDPTPPVVTPVITGTLGLNGWYTTNVTVNWTVTDPESIILSTTGCNAVTFTTSTTGTTLTCSAESDGGTTTVLKTFKVDKTAPATTATPSRAADSNGWYNHELSVDFEGSDTTSGLESCSPDATYAGPDTSATTVTGTCRDRAGNTAPANLPLKYDETAPQSSPVARPPDRNGWHNHAVTVTFQGTDGTSGVATCTQTTYAGPDDPSVALTGTCVDQAGNESPSALYTTKYDETPPQATATASPPDFNGWHNRALTVSYAGSDSMSGLDFCDPPESYAGPDSATASVSGTCRDLAGNASVRSVVVKYDATPPQVTGSPARAANAAGWYRAPLAVTFAGTDPVSGVASCVQPPDYSAPDSAAASVSGRCTDHAGNTRNASFGFKYDAAPPHAIATPSRQPNGNGWFNAALTVAFSGSDAVSGIGSCDPARTYSTPDASSASLSGACVDQAGNQSAPAAYAFKYDATAPVASATASRLPNANGWYRAPVDVSFAATDALSGLDFCDQTRTYSGPDAASTSVTGVCRDKAGNADSASVPVKYDATPPQATATPSRQPNANGWYNASLSVGFSATDALSGPDSCDPAKNYAGPDVASIVVTGTCFDKAGNSQSAPFTVKYDATAPSATATPSRAANANGWYRAPVDVGFAATDLLSGFDSCDATKSYTGPDTVSTTVSGACRDKAGNSGSASAQLRYDATPPDATATASRQPNAQGWYRAPVDVSFAATDALSGPDTCPQPRSYGGPDNGSAVVEGTCVDKAGNGRLASLTLRYDATPPSVSVTPSRQPNANGWFNAPVTVDFAGADTLSGLEACPATKSYGGPDAVSAVLSGTCTDKAGNGTLASYPLKYDATAPRATATPRREPNTNGWHNASVSVDFTGSDETSGIGTCDPAKTYSTPDSASAVLSGTCNDRAGNSSQAATVGFKYDATPPQVASTTPTRPTDRAGWYNRPVAFAVNGTDATSGIDSCPPQSYTGPDSATATFSGACLDKAGNRGTKDFALKYDATGPATSATADRSSDSNGWFNHPLTVSFSGTDAVSGTDSCSPPESYTGPDSAEAVVGGVCLDEAGNVGLASLSVSYDATAPVVTDAEPDRRPDANGWYNHPLVVGFRGSDATSGIESCTQASYAGPDTAVANVTGSCRDHAGNAGGSLPFQLRFDSTAPELGELRVTPGNGKAVLSWKASPDTTLVEIRRGTKRVYSGTATTFTDTGLTNGVRYRYTLAGYDEAANSTTEAVAATPSGPLVSPAAGAVVKAPPRLAWKAAPKATYYHVQLWRNGRILSAWPRGTSFQLRRTWIYNGRRYRLRPGLYRWYVWPGRGRPAQKEFGNLLGSSSFRVR